MQIPEEGYPAKDRLPLDHVQYKLAYQESAVSIILIFVSLSSELNRDNNYLTIDIAWQKKWMQLLLDSSSVSIFESSQGALAIMGVSLEALQVSFSINLCSCDYT